MSYPLTFDKLSCVFVTPLSHQTLILSTALLYEEDLWCFCVAFLNLVIVYILLARTDLRLVFCCSFFISATLHALVVLNFPASMKIIHTNRKYITYLLLFISSSIAAQSLDDVWLPAQDHSDCYQDGYIDILHVDRYFDVETSTYLLNLTSVSNLTISNLNKNGTMSSASTFQLKFGFKSIPASPQQFCPDVIEGCPIAPGINFTIQKVFNLSELYIPVYPLADITAQYSALDANAYHLVCVRVAPVGYQHSTWQRAFIYIPISLTVVAGIISLFVTIHSLFLQKERHSEDSNAESSYYEHSFFAAFNYTTILSPNLLRLKTPGLLDLITYIQFIVVVGQFNLEYPRFHALFTSNFSWSFLIWKTSWLENIVTYLNSSTAVSLVDAVTIQNHTLSERQKTVQSSPATNVSDINHDNSNDLIEGSGMVEFATAAGVNINGLFLSMLVYLCLMLAVSIVTCFCIFVVLQCLSKWYKNHDAVNDERSTYYSIKAHKVKAFSIGIFVRIIGMFFLPILTQSFYQLMIPSLWYITLCAAILLVGPLLMYGSILIILLQIRPSSLLFTELKLLLPYGSLYNTYTDDSFRFFIAILSYKFIVAAMIGLFQTSSLAQLILVIGAELIMALGVYIKWPYSDGQVNLFHLILGCIKTFTLGINIAYLPQLKTTVLLKQCMGYVQLGMHGLVFFLFLIMIVRNILFILVKEMQDEGTDTGTTGQPLSRLRHIFWNPRSQPKGSRNSNQSIARLIRQSQQSIAPTASATLLGHTRTYSNQTLTTHRLTANSQTIARMSQYFVMTPPASNNTTRISLLKPDEVDGNP